MMKNKTIYGVPPLVLAQMPYIAALGLIRDALKQEKDAILYDHNKDGSARSYEEIAGSQEMEKMLTKRIEEVERMQEELS